MDVLKLGTRPRESLHKPEVHSVQEELLLILLLHGPLSVEELVEHLPQFRWVDVLRAASWLWGEGRIEVEQDPGGVRMRVASLANCEHVGGFEDKISKKIPESPELTCP